MVSAEYSRERDYVAMLYRRVDDLRSAAVERLARIHVEDVGGNHQSRSERDAFARSCEDRIAQLGEVSERLVFGRLELSADQEIDDTEGDSLYRYIGRIGLRDDTLKPLLLDWRVPQAGPFYQATAANPLGIRARRHLQIAARELVKIEDEIFDASLFDSADATLQGEAALLAVLNASRTGQMHDIVATIQAEQDRIIRSELSGVLIVQGGPGTGKTAVALHRAAYLLYTHRDQISRSGVLIVGPSRAFLHYIEAVLPSLGETGVVLASVGQLYPGIEVAAEDAAEVAALKGSVEMAALLKNAVRSRQKIPAEPQQLNVNGETLALHPEVIVHAMERARQSGKPYNEARVVFVKQVLSRLTQLFAQQLQSQGNAVDEDDYAMLREDLRSAYDVRVALNTAWIPLTPEKLLNDLYARPQWLASLTPQWSVEKRALLRRSRDAPFTVSDVALLDEAAELLGEYTERAAATERERESRRNHDLENAQNAIRNMGVEGLVRAEDVVDGFSERVARKTIAERAATERSWTYAHVVVDEAQELSGMQWRMLRRRCPLRSFTIVGDIAQASSAAGVKSWQEALAPLLGETQHASWRQEELTVNYRTPSQIADAAYEMASKQGLPVTRARSVRETEWPITVHHVSGDTEQAVHQQTLQAILDDRVIDAHSAIAVIAPEARLPALAQFLSDSLPGEVARGEAGLSSKIAVLAPNEAKGLEFDSVFIVDQHGILNNSRHGAAQLYVAMTRPTQRLSFLNAAAPF